MTSVQTDPFNRYLIKMTLHNPHDQNDMLDKQFYIKKLNIQIFLKLSKSRSHSWNDSPASPSSSIWSGSFKTAFPAPSFSAAAQDRPPSTRGKERVISLGGLKLSCRELQVKRPREGEKVTSFLSIHTTILLNFPNANYHIFLDSIFLT